MNRAVVVPSIEVTEEPIAAVDLGRRVACSTAGATVTFEGTVRNHHDGKPVDHLEYEAYGPMAEIVIREIAERALERWQLQGVAVSHRFGALEIGDVSVAIAVSSVHRAQAFEAVRMIIDELKQRAPIWKKETGPDGSFWIEGPEQIPTQR